MRIALRKILSLFMISLIFINILNLSVVLASGETFSSSAVSTYNDIDSYKPWDNIIFSVSSQNLNTLSAINPWVYFKPNIDLNYLNNSWSWYVQYSRTSTPKDMSWYDWISSFSWVLSWVNLAQNYRFWVKNLTFTIPSNYSSKTISYVAKFWSDNFLNYTHPWTNDAVLHVNVVPHIQSISLSKGSIFNNWVDSTDLTVKVLDYNGCSNLNWWSSYVRADLSSIWMLNETLTYDSCESDWYTAIFKKTWIKSTWNLTPWSYTFWVTVSDNDWNLGWSDSFYSSDDKVNQWSIIVNSISSPEITFLTPSVDTLYGPNNPTINLSWQSSQSWSYVINFWLSPTCSSWLNIWNWDVSAWWTINSTFNYNDAWIVSWDNKIIVCVTNGEPTQWSNSLI